MTVDVQGAPDLWIAVTRALEAARDVHPDRFGPGELDLHTRITEDALDILDEVRDPRDPQAWQRAAHLVEYYEDGDHDLAWHAIATALSTPPAHVRELVERWLGDAEQVTLAEGALVPCPDFHLPLGVGEPATRPGSTTIGPGETGTVRRWHAPTGWEDLRVTVTTELGPALMAALPLETPMRIATITPNEKRDELTGLNPAEDDFGYPVAPRDETRQRAIVLGALEPLYDEEDAPHLVVIPETAVTREIQDAIATSVDQAQSRTLIVAGSRHETDDGIPRNVAAITTAGLGRHDVHTKLRPAAGERIEGAHSLTVHQVGPFRFGVLICADLLPAPLTDLVRSLGVTHIVVPACSRKTTAFEDALGAISQRTQALAVVANNPCTWPDPERTQPYTRYRMVAQLPLQSPAHHLVDPGPYDQPGVIRFSLGDHAPIAQPLP